MDAKLYIKMISDKNLTNLEKMQYKYSIGEVAELLELMKSVLYKPLSIQDFNGVPLVYTDHIIGCDPNAIKLLAASPGTGMYGINAMENEIFSTLSIENIESSRDSIRRIIKGYAPVDDDEKRITGIKKGLDFIADPDNKITEQNIYKLYHLAIGGFLEEDKKLLPGGSYRHDRVYVVGGDYLLQGKIDHEGLPFQRIPKFMGEFVKFIHVDNGMNDLLKAAVIHFYLAYLHPYFDGNGRMARFMHMWYLISRGYPGTLFYSFSTHIGESRKMYYDAFTQVEKNAEISHVVDVTPFLIYFVKMVYDKIGASASYGDSVEKYKKALSDGRITEKEAKLWDFVCSAYGNGEFSTKQLEKDFGNAAYATIHSFVLKFHTLDLLDSRNYTNRVKYRVKLD